MICYLKISTWVGLSIGATHYYGKLWCGEADPVELTYHLNESQAKEMNTLDGDMYTPGYLRWKKGDETGRFFIYDDVVEKALETWQQHFPNATVLIEGDHCISDPQPVLEGPKDFKDTVNKLHREFEAIGRYEGDEDRAEEIFHEFQDVLTKFNLQR